MNKLFLILSIAFLTVGSPIDKETTEPVSKRPQDVVVTADEVPDSLQTAISQYVESFATENKCQFIVKVGKPGKSAFYAGFDGKTNRKTTNFETPYEIGSATKMFTAASILQLIEGNKFALDDALTKVLPNKTLYKGLLEIDGKDYIDSVKVVNLLNHTSGFPDYFAGSDEKEIELHADPSLVFTPEELIELSKQHITDPFIPGTKFKYCNVNYLLLGMIIEKYSGMTYQEYFKQRIFSPLKLEQTYLGSIDPPAKKIQGHYKGKKVEMPPTLAGPAGEVISTLDDMDRFVNAWYQGELFRDKSTRKMLMNDNFHEMGLGINYGLGVVNLMDLSKGHGGQTFGVQSYAGALENGYCFEFLIDDASVSAWSPAIKVSSLLSQLPK